jgi:hypothetical protein
LETDALDDTDYAVAYVGSFGAVEDVYAFDEGGTLDGEG